MTDDIQLAKVLEAITGQDKSRKANKRFLWATVPVLVAALALSVKLVVEGFSRNKGFDYAALGELLLVLVIGVGEFIAFFELREIVADRTFRSWLKLQQSWTDEKFVALRTKLFVRMDNLQAPWTEEETKEGLDMCRRLDEFAYLAGFSGFDKVLILWDDVLAKSWVVLEEIVKREHKKVGTQRKWIAFSALGKRALEKVVSEGRDPRNRKPNLSVVP